MKNNPDLVFVSHNEIVMFCRKALEGLGVSVGELEDAADAVGWLALHGIDGITPFHQLLTDLPPNATPLLPTDNRLFDGGGQSALFLGPAVLDYGFVQAISQHQTTLTVEKCRHPLSLIAYIIRCAKRGVSLAAQWHEPALQRETTITVDAESSFPTVTQYFPKGEKEPSLICSDEVVDLTLSFTTNHSLASADLVVPQGQYGAMKVYSPAHFEAQWRHHTEEGILVDAAPWAAVQEIGKLVLVEATEESRQRGAGEAA